ncbi:MAG: hypothetical protein ABJD97_16190 [Betaproteobacteria bacterium]
MTRAGRAWAVTGGLALALASAALASAWLAPGTVLALWQLASWCR